VSVAARFRQRIDGRSERSEELQCGRQWRPTQVSRTAGRTRSEELQCGRQWGPTPVSDPAGRTFTVSSPTSKGTASRPSYGARHHDEVIVDHAHSA